jgi:hypothetical protein
MTAVSVRRRAALATAALLLAGCGGSGSSGAGPGAGSAQTGTAAAIDSGTPFACPSSPTRITATPGLTSLPRGATAARICWVDNGLLWLPPVGVLNRGVPPLVHFVNAQHVHQPYTACTDDLGPAYAIRFRYPDGIRTITADTAGCGDIAVGSTKRNGGRTLFHAYLAALLRQRHRQGSPDAVFPPATCPAQRRDLAPYSPLADAGRLQTAVLCSIDGRQQTRLTSAQVQVFRHEFATAAHRRTDLEGASSCHRLPPRSSVAVVGVDGWGDSYTVLTTCDTYRILRPAHGDYVFARMLPATARMLRGLLAS